MNVRIVSLVLIAALALTGVGGGIYVIVDQLRSSDGQGYCSALGGQRSVFSNDGTGVALLNDLDGLRDVARQAPDDLTDEWQIVLTAFEGLASALKSAGVKPEDFAGGPPTGLSEKDAKAISAAASRLTEADVVEAFGGIDQQAKDVCKLQLGL